jgi:hypothetical protein
MNLKIYEETLNLDKPNEVITINSFAPLKVYVNPSNAKPYLPNNNFTLKISKIIYDWGDGSIEEQKFKPSLYSSPTETGLIRENGDPRNFAKTHQYSLSTQFTSQFNIKISLYQFTLSTPVVYNYRLNLKAPRLDGTKTSFFKNMHLIYTKMFGVDNKILYVFEGKDPTWSFPVVVDWRRKGGEFLPVLGSDYDVY